SIALFIAGAIGCRSRNKLAIDGERASAALKLLAPSGASGCVAAVPVLLGTLPAGGVVARPEGARTVVEAARAIGVGPPQAGISAAERAFRLNDFDVILGQLVHETRGRRRLVQSPQPPVLGE